MMTNQPCPPLPSLSPSPSPLSLSLSPTELLSRIFHILYEDLEIIDEATFIEWRDNGTEAQGKGMAVYSLKDFFQWLENANQESDTES